MTLDQALRAVCMAVQPFMDRDKPNPRGVDEFVAEVYVLFDEEPTIREAFGAAVVSIAEAARVGWRPIE